MASLYDAFKTLLKGKDPTDEQMKDPELIDQASVILQAERKKQWTQENKKNFGIKGETPQDQLKLDEENAKVLSSSENKG